MTIVREPMWDDAPRSRTQALSRHLLQFLSTLGWTARILVSSVAAFPSVLLRRFNQEIYLGAAVMLTLLREMGPFACGISLAACVGSAIAAELGTMKVNDEIAALEIMSISPIRYLAAPRLLALIVMAPILAFYCSVIGTLGGGIVGSTQLNVFFQQYISSALSIAETKDLFVGLLKAGVFGMLIGTVSVAEGFGTKLGATGVGRSTQQSVIVNFLLILMFGYMITRVFYR